MAKLVEMDERVGIFTQMEEDVGPVILKLFLQLYYYSTFCPDKNRRNKGPYEPQILEVQKAGYKWLRKSGMPTRQSPRIVIFCYPRILRALQFVVKKYSGTWLSIFLEAGRPELSQGRPT
jgi:hypothetical protein